MSVSGKPPSGASGSKLAVLVRAVFCRRVHVLIAEGYVRLAPKNLADAAEEDITGELVRAMNEHRDHPSSPQWVDYCLPLEEERVNQGKKLGKKRSRLDITFEYARQRPHPRFRFECKRLRKSGDVAKYLFAEGMGAFLDGTYAAEDSQVGMIGYVQLGTADEWVKKIHQRMAKDNKKLGLVGARVWTDKTFDARIGVTRESHHRRKTKSSALAVFHTFLTFN